MTQNPMLNVPKVALILPIGLIIGWLLLQILIFTLPTQAESFLNQLILMPNSVRNGAQFALFTYSFLHISLLDVVMNAALLLAFGSSYFRATGHGLSAFIGFMTFFILCGVVAGVVFSFTQRNADAVAIGASASVTGIMGAAMRLPNFWASEGKLNSYRSQPVILFSVFVLVFYGIFGLMGDFSGKPQGGIGWQAHLVCYFFGVGFIEAWLRVMHPSYFSK